MKITTLIQAEKNPPTITHRWMQTMVCVGCSSTEELGTPKAILTLARKHPTSEVVEYGDSTLGIEIGGKLWAAEIPDPQFRPAKKLPREVWQWARAVTGRDSWE